MKSKKDLPQLAADDELDLCLVALAVLGQATPDDLAALLDKPVTPSSWQSLVQREDIVMKKDTLEIKKTVAADILKATERLNTRLYRTLHERAIAFLAERFQAGQNNLEPALVAISARLADRLLTDDPQMLMALMHTLKSLPWQNAHSKHQQRFYEAVALRRTEQYATALAAFDELLAEPDLAIDLHARALNSRATCYLLTARPERAIAGYQQSLLLWQQLGNEHQRAIVLLNLGIISYELRRYQEAEAHLNQAATIFETLAEPTWLAVVRNEQGLLFRDQGRWAEALTCFEAFVNRRKLEGAQDNVGLGLLNMGEVRLFQGHLEEARALLEEAAVTLQVRTFQVDIRLFLGLLNQATGQAEQALASFNSALELALKIGRQDFLPHVYYHLGQAHQRRGDMHTALDCFLSAVQSIEATRAPIGDESIKISLLGRWQQVYEALVCQYLDMGEVSTACTWAERARARAFADLVGEGRIESVPTIADMQAALPANTVVLAYFTTGVLDWDMPLLKHIPADNPLREILLLPARTILFALTQGCITAYDCGIDPNHFSSASPRGRHYDRFLQQQMLPLLRNTLLTISLEAVTAERLVIIPHGPLHHVPFSALVEYVPLAYAPSATVLFSREAVGFPSDALGLAVGYNGRRDHRLLRYTEAEVRAVARLMGGDTWTGPESKKELLRQAAVSRRWLHISCHGWFNEVDPLLSYLETGQDEKLTAGEVLANWRLSAELVTLSACQTGVSHVLRGDEPMGLIRAFLHAGARAVLVSQWPVEDLPTYLLMTRFYQLLNKGSDYALALRQAQDWLRDLSGPQIIAWLATLPADEQVIHDGLPAGLPSGAYPFAHPRYWAAFVLYVSVMERKGSN